MIGLEIQYRTDKITQLMQLGIFWENECCDNLFCSRQCHESVMEHGEGSHLDYAGIPLLTTGHPPKLIIG